MKTLSKTYQPKDIEEGIINLWEKGGYANPDNHILPSCAKSYSIPLPPPNATGTLHLGHAMYVIQDIMIRRARMDVDEPKRTVWIPGTDHAAIATNAIIERQLQKEGKKKEDIGREEFLRRVHAFIKKSQGKITQQLKRMGFSLDWSREAYTLDHSRSEAVKEIFQRMFRDELIYRGVRVVNWDPQAQSAISDDEVDHELSQATLTTFRYSKHFPIPIATTRPETKVGDAAVAVHPDDSRYQQYIGKHFEVSFAGTQLHIRIIADNAIDPAFGTGAVGVTPSHSVIDAEYAMKYGLPFLTVINEKGRMTKEAGNLVAGLKILDARKKITEWLKKENLLEREEMIEQNISTSERTGAIIEPLPKEQWFINVNKPFPFHQSRKFPIKGIQNGDMVTLKQLLRHVVETEQIIINPEHFRSVYFQWIDNLRDWNISRQIWFGHQVPVWYKTNDHGKKKMVVGDKPKEDGWTQDPDTLDTWFSSGIWTFSILGWPRETEDLERYHPMDVLETGYDLIFFWVARMILMTTYGMGEIPFHKVFLHGLVRDSSGEKMSKSKGNGIDPLLMIDQFGCDALRLALISGTTPGNDQRFSEAKIVGERNFMNKFWNIARFIIQGVEKPRYVSNIPKEKTEMDHWMMGWFKDTTEEVNLLMERDQYGVAVEKLRILTWNRFADWYIESAKVERGKQEHGLYFLQVLLRLWHPFIPFLTEYVYQCLEGRDPKALMMSPWPGKKESERMSEHVDPIASEKVEVMMKIVNSIRAKRMLFHISPQKSVLISGDWKRDHSIRRFIEHFGRVKWVPEITGRSIALTHGIRLDIEGIDFQKEYKKTGVEFKQKQEAIQRCRDLLNNSEFVNRARPNAIDSQRVKLSQLEKEYQECAERRNELESWLETR